jgi:rod shape-determining protein MreB
MDQELTMEVRGRDLIAGLPRTITIGSNEITEAMDPVLQQIITSVKAVLEETPPELASDVIDKGMVLSGGGALLRNMDKLLTQVTGVACYVAENPLYCVAKGTGLALEHIDFFRRSLVAVHEVRSCPRGSTCSGWASTASISPVRPSRSCAASTPTSAPS